jgi:hypothetical protein
MANRVQSHLGVPGGYACCSGRLADRAVWPAPEPKIGPARLGADVRCRVGMVILGGALPAFLHSSASFQ